MPGRRKKHHKNFRDVAKEGASHFEVGYRSQKDPMLADNEASEHVLVPKESNSKENRLEEQMKYGIYFEDDYDYLQHLRDVKEIHQSEMLQLPGFQMKEEEDEETMSVSMASTTASRLQLPSSVLGSTVERDVGLLNMAAASAEPKEDWDPEVMEALDDNFDFEDPDNVLDDDFMQLANAEEGPESGGQGDDLIDESGDDDDDEWEDADEDTETAEEDGDEIEETDEKSKSLAAWLHRVHLEGQADRDAEGDEFGWEEGEDDDLSEYSVDGKGGPPAVSKFSAAMVPRNENLQFIDKMTEALIEREYSWDKMGALDGEELAGRVTFNSDLFKQAYNELVQSQEKVTMKDLFNSEDKVRPTIPESWKYVEEKDYSVEEDIDRNLEPLVTTQKPQYDAKSILTTYSNTKNLPTRIVLPEDGKKKKKKKTSESLTDTASESTLPGLTLKDLQREWRQERMADRPSTYRPKSEAIEERKERKLAVKAHQRERRAEKKLNKQIFRGEEQLENKMKDNKTVYSYRP